MSLTLITARWIITPNTSGTSGNTAVSTLANAAVLVADDGLIVAVGPTAELETRANIATRIDLPNHLLAPGLINAHCHSAMTLLRGAADDLPLDRWLRERIWPMEQALLDDSFVNAGTKLAAAEMLLGGTTTCVDMYFYSKAGAQAYLAMGQRAMLALGIVDFPSNYAPDADTYISVGLAARDAFADEPLLSFCLAPHAPYTVSDATFERVVAFASELAIPIHTHLQETAQEVTDATSATGERPTARMARLGVLGPEFFAAHCVHMNDEDIEAFARHNGAVVHCPSSNLKLASGLAPIAKFLAAGVTVALGTDGAASNNRLDMFEEMRLAALIGKVQANDASAVNASEAFTMATLGGARAIGLSALTGSIETGKAADMLAISLDAPAMKPLFDPVSHFVYTASRSDVTHVWVQGEARVIDGALVGAAAQAMAELDPHINAFAERVAALRH